MHQHIVKYFSCASCFTPWLFSLLSCEHFQVHHGSGSSHQSWKGSLLICILLWGPCSCVFKTDAKSFCFTLFFKFLILSSIITSDKFHLNLTLIFDPLNQEQTISTWSDFFFKKKLCLHLVASSTSIAQCPLPPRLSSFIDDISGTFSLQDI